MPTPSVTLPARAEGIELLGTPGGSGYEQSQALVRRADGQTLQLTPLLYQLLELLDGERDVRELAAELSRATTRGSATPTDSSTPAEAPTADPTATDPSPSNTPAPSDPGTPAPTDPAPSP